MESYRFYKKTSRILAEDKIDQLFQFMIYCMDQNGIFLRTSIAIGKKLWQMRKWEEYTPQW